HGHTEWLPPPHLDHGQPRTNTFHHPERFLHNQDDDDEPDPQQSKPHATTPHNHKHRVRQGLAGANTPRW
ncbi:hypothetical protein, partial [Mycobacterium tuberculosis]